MVHWGWSGWGNGGEIGEKIDIFQNINIFGFYKNV